MVVVLALVVSASVALEHPALSPLSDELISYVNENSKTWTAAKNKFNSWPYEEVKRLLGVRPDVFEKAKHLPKQQLVVGDIPSKLIFKCYEIQRRKCNTHNNKNNNNKTR